MSLISSLSGIDRLVLYAVLEIGVHGLSEADDVDRVLKILREGILDVHEVEKIGIGHLHDDIDVARLVRLVPRDRSEDADPFHAIIALEGVLAAANPFDRIF
jgi:hypothetical protein